MGEIPNHSIFYKSTLFTHSMSQSHVDVGISVTVNRSQTHVVNVMMSKSDASYSYKELFYVRQPAYVLGLCICKGNTNLKKKSDSA